MKYLLICTLFFSCVPMDHSQFAIGESLRKVTPKEDVHCLEETWYGLKRQPAIHIHCGHDAANNRKKYIRSIAIDTLHLPHGDTVKLKPEDAGVLILLGRSVCVWDGNKWLLLTNESKH